ncbi:MAG: hypothetical protein K5905_30540 [Roseibium sp.]|uniref:hypothetical protein n=1 Tax=Roseibium sp. TaxID=1936156 RepID=UPI00262F93AA|nr:hypothetical protein [Roseibium sp.]MCV0429799.1 hypothetical protein [Roseibium sp.]
MLQNGATELIWHFAGYLHITDELARARTDYEDLNARRNEVDLEFAPANVNFNQGELDQLGSGRSNLFWPDADKNGYDVPDNAMRFLSAGPRPVDFKLGADPNFFQPYFPGNQSGTEFVSGPNVTRQEWGHETNVDIDQINLLNDSDLFGVEEGLTIYAVSGVNIAYHMTHMEVLATDAIPEELFPKGGGNPGVTGPNLAAAQMAKAASGEELSTVEPGLYIDGVLQVEETEEETTESSSGTSDDTEARREGAPPPIPEQESGWAPGDTGLVGAELGSNTVYNGAVIVDLDEGVGTFVVLGDYYQTNTVAQVNVYTDSDYVQLGNAGASVSLNENEATNTAQMTKQALLDDVIDYRGFTGYFWDIDISYGDYFDVKSLYQENTLYSNDIVSQESSGAHQRVMADANGQYNVATVEDIGNSYDLIVVLGNYFSGNFIHQTNILLDNDWVTMTADGEAGSQTIYGGQNQLSNEAGIISYSMDEFGSVSSGFEAFLLGLETKDRIEPEDWWSYSGSGSTEMKVLFVTGDYYDVNFIKQLNIVSDSDAAMQVGGHGSNQFISTGGNTVTNVATIIDVGAYGDQYVGGEAYEEWTLVQTNIIAGEDDEIIYGDADQLANEVVAFTYVHEEEEEPQCTDVLHSPHSGDELGQLMA